MSVEHKTVVQWTVAQQSAALRPLTWPMVKYKSQQLLSGKRSRNVINRNPFLVTVYYLTLTLICMSLPIPLMYISLSFPLSNCPCFHVSTGQLCYVIIVFNETYIKDGDSELHQFVFHEIARLKTRNPRTSSKKTKLH